MLTDKKDFTMKLSTKNPNKKYRHKRIILSQAKMAKNVQMLQQCSVSKAKNKIAVIKKQWLKFLTI